MTFVMQTWSDYLFTHSQASPAAVPPDFVEFCRFWVREMDTGDTPRPLAGGRSLFLEDGLAFVRSAQPVANADRDVLDPTLVAAIDALDPIFSGQRLSDFADEIAAENSRGLDTWTVNIIVQGAAVVGEALRPHIGDRQFQLPHWAGECPGRWG